MYFLSVFNILDLFFFFKQKTAYEVVSRDWSSDVCSSDLDSERLLVEMSRHPDNKEGVSAWMEKRDPQWTGD